LIYLGCKPERPSQIQLPHRCTSSHGIVKLVQYLKKGDIELNPIGNPALEPLLKWLSVVYCEDPAAP
jgi:hypothetical protein